MQYTLDTCSQALTLWKKLERRWRPCVTRQMMIIAGGEPELCCRRHAKLEGGVYGPLYALRVRKSCPECSVHVLCLCRSVKRGLCEVTGEKN